MEKEIIFSGEESGEGGYEAHAGHLKISEATMVSSMVRICLSPARVPITLENLILSFSGSKI